MNNEDKFNAPIMNKLPRIKALLQESRQDVADQVYERTVRHCSILPTAMLERMKEKDFKKLEDTLFRAFKECGWITLLGHPVK